MEVGSGQAEAMQGVSFSAYVGAPVLSCIHLAISK